MKSNKASIQQIAQLAGVGVATVDRVLNQRAKVRPGTAIKVLEAAEALGYHAANLIRQRVMGKEVIQFGFCLQKHDDPFYMSLALAIQNSCKNFSQNNCAIAPIIEFVDSLDPAQISKTMLQLGKKVDVMAVVAIDHPIISDTIEELKNKNCPCFTLLSDVSAPSRAGYIGTNDRQRGRTAAWLIHHLNPVAPAKVIAVVGSHRYLGQQLSEMSFRAYMREHAPHLQVLDTLFNLEDQRLGLEATQELFALHPELVGIYVAGGGVSGIIEAAQQELKNSQLKKIIVCNELVPAHKKALIEDSIQAVMQTPLELLVRQVLQEGVLAQQQYHHQQFKTQNSNGVHQPRISYIPFNLLTKENC